MNDNLLVFGLNASHEYAGQVTEHLNVRLAEHDEKYFEDGEAYVQANVNVRGRDVFVIQSLYGDGFEDINAKFVKLLMFAGALKDASAERITLIIPYLIGARQDRKTTSRAPITTKYVAQLIESVGVDRVLLIDIHNLSSVQNSFRIPLDNLESKNLHADWCYQNLDQDSKIVVLSPDSGGYARAVRFRNALVRRFNTNIDVAILDKLRVDDKVHGSRIVGDVSNAKVIIYDDMISTGGTMFQAYKAIKANKGQVAAICATHGLFVGKAMEYFREMETNVVIADTIPPDKRWDNSRNSSKLHCVNTTKMVAEAIKRIHSGTGSISDLLK